MSDVMIISLLLLNNITNRLILILKNNYGFSFRKHLGP